MNKLIRSGTFETNSSSTHSYTVCNKANTYDTLYPDPDGSLVIKGGDFGWEFDYYDDVYSKVSYVATLINEHLSNLDEYISSGDCEWLRRYIPSNLFVDGVSRIKETVQNLFEQVIKDHTGATKVIYDTEDCYIDHQSWDSGCDILGFSYDEMKNFLFNPGSTLYTGNDNDCMMWHNGSLVDRDEVDEDEL